MPSNHHPKQNRVNPLGEIIAVEDRGTLMGNRGCLHDDNQKIVRPFKVIPWIYCTLHYLNSEGEPHKREIMRSGRYTELFFLDEATALAAGHRPCCQCKRERFNELRQFWSAANPEYIQGDRSKARAADMDKALHQERLTPSHTKQMYQETLSVLPFGSFVLLQETSDQPYLVTENHLVPWKSSGYGEAVEKPGQQKVWVLTPPSIVQSLTAGFHPNVHPSLLQCV